MGSRALTVRVQDRFACARLARTLDRELRRLRGPAPRPVDCARLELLTSLYDDAEPPPVQALTAFVASHRHSLAALYRAYQDDPRARAFTAAPEALLIFERLEHDPDRLADLWRRHFPYEELEQLAAFYGLAI